MQSAWPSVYSDAEFAIETRYPNWQTDPTQESARELKLGLLNEFGAALSSLHSEANK